MNPTDARDCFEAMGLYYGMSVGEVIVSRGRFFDFLRERIGSPFKHTTPVCDKALDCGASCFLPPTHLGPCLCISDDDDEPGTCPA